MLRTCFSPRIGHNLIMKHIVQQFEYGPHKVAIDYILGQLKISSVRIKERDEQFLETAI